MIFSRRMNQELIALGMIGVAAGRNKKNRSRMTGGRGKKGSMEVDCFADVMLTSEIVNTGAAQSIMADNEVDEMDREPYMDIGWSFYNLRDGSGTMVGSYTFVQVDPDTMGQVVGLGYRFPQVVQGVFTIETADCSGLLMYSGQQTTGALGEFVITGGTGDFFAASGTITVGAFNAGTFPVEIEFA